MKISVGKLAPCGNLSLNSRLHLTIAYWISSQTSN